MANELEDLYGRISFIEGEKVGIKIKEGDVAEARGAGRICLVGKVWTDKNVNKEAFKFILSTIGTLQGVKFKEFKDNIWLFKFSDEVNKRRVMEGRMWSFVTPPKLALANPVESLAIHPFKPTCDQTGNHPYKKCQSKCKGR
jgi:hypothetical protein